MFQVKYKGEPGRDDIKPGIHGTFATYEEAKGGVSACRAWFKGHAKVWIEGPGVAPPVVAPLPADPVPGTPMAQVPAAVRQEALSPEAAELRDNLAEWEKLSSSEHLTPAQELRLEELTQWFEAREGGAQGDGSRAQTARPHHAESHANSDEPGQEPAAPLNPESDVFKG